MILIAPNAFKGSLDASSAADLIAEGLHVADPSIECKRFPVGDGGDGTGALLRHHLNAATTSLVVQGPDGADVEASFGFIAETKTAIIELADASGLRIADRSGSVMRRSTYGAGQLLRACLQKNPEKIILCLGGSATVDGGVGILHALGARLLDAYGNNLQGNPTDLARLHSIDLSGVDTSAFHGKLKVLCDVNNPMLGTEGAATVFGPQKGATKEQIPLLESGLKNVADAIRRNTGQDVSALQRGGAAGGVAATLHSIFNAPLLPGIEFFLDVTGFDHALQDATLVITGEGSVDDQTLQGKGPFGVARRAKDRKIPVVAFSGVAPHSNEKLRNYFDSIVAINPENVSLEVAMRNTRINLLNASVRLGREIRDGAFQHRA